MVVRKWALEIYRAGASSYRHYVQDVACCCHHSDRSRESPLSTLSCTVPDAATIMLMVPLVSLREHVPEPERDEHRLTRVASRREPRGCLITGQCRSDSLERVNQVCSNIAEQKLYRNIRIMIETVPPNRDCGPVPPQFPRTYSHTESKDSIVYLTATFPPSLPAELE